jgi:hypothetical protein
VWGRDDDAAEKEIERKLARLAPGETLPLLGSGPTSEPICPHIALGKPTTDRSVVDRAFKLQAFDPPGMLDLVRAVPLDRYQIQAQVRHESDQNGGGFVGLYLGRKAYAAAAGEVQVFLQLTFNDISSRKEWVERQNEKQKKDRPDLPPIPVPAGNALSLTAVMDYHDREGSSPLDVELTQAAIEPLGYTSQWRSVLIKVTPQAIRVYWDGAGTPTLEAPTALIAKKLRASLDNAPWLQGRLLKTPIGFDPHGSIGLCASQGAASFQSVLVGPLGPEG